MTKNILSQSNLIELFDYNSVTGIFIWKKRSKGRRSSNVAGSVTPNGYIVIGVCPNLIRPAHRLAWIYVYGDIPEGMVVDHINRNRSDNRIQNLRLLTIKENNKNQNPSRKKLEPRSRLKHFEVAKQTLENAISSNKKETQVLKNIKNVAPKQQQEKKLSRLSKMLGTL